MANRKIFELPEADQLSTSDELVVSTAGTGKTTRAAVGRLPFPPLAGGGVARTILDKLSDAVSVRDFGAVGDGATDDAPAFQAALDAHQTIWVPAGRYRLASPVQVKPKRRIVGEGRDTVEIMAGASHAFVFHRNEGDHVVDGSAATDWNRSSISGLTVRMTLGGLRVYGHEFRADDINFFGGSAPIGQADENGWCIDMIDANEAMLSRINAGYGGGSGHAMGANGIRWRAMKPGVNYGDSCLQEISIKLAAANTAAILIDGHLASATSVMNNMLLQRIQVNAPAGGSGVTPLPGTNGIKLWNAARICQIDCDVEVVAVAFEEYSDSLGGTAGACVGNTYIGCIAHWCTVNYRDSNAVTVRSVVQRNFIGCDNVAPLKTGIADDDGGRGQDGDAYLQGAWLMNRNGDPAVQLRCRDKDVLLLTSDHKGDQQTNADGHPSQGEPYHGILFDVSSPQMAKITRTVAMNAPDPDDAAQQLLDVRLELGNGEGDNRGELARVQINDPLLLRPRTSQPPRPYDGLIHYAATSDALPGTGDWFMGAGIYCRLNGGEYAPMAVQRGATPERERNNSFTVSHLDFGKVLRVNNGGDRTITIPAGLVPPGAGARRFWVIRQGSGAVEFLAGEGVSLHAAEGRTKIAKQFQTVEVLVLADNSVYLNHIAPDTLEPFERRLHWTSGNMTLPSYHLGKILRVSSNDTSSIEIPKGLVPDGMNAASVRIMKVGFGDVSIEAGPGMTLLSPTGVTPYVITQQGKSVEVVISSSDTQQPDHIYIID